MMDFNATMANALEQLRMENELVYLMGDYNIDLLNSEKHDLTNEFIIPTEQRSCWGVYWFHSVRLSVRLSVRPSVPAAVSAL